MPHSKPLSATAKPTRRPAPSTYRYAVHPPKQQPVPPSRRPAPGPASAASPAARPAVAIALKPPGKVPGKLPIGERSSLPRQTERTAPSHSTTAQSPPGTPAIRPPDVLERLPFAGILPPIAWLPFFRSLFDLRACFGPIHASARRTALSGQALLAALLEAIQTSLAANRLIRTRNLIGVIIRADIRPE